MYAKAIALLISFSVLLGCANKPIVRTETVEVKVPVLVPLDKRLTEEVAEPKLAPGIVQNNDLADFIDAWRAALRLANRKLREIAGVQPSSAP